MRSLWHSSKVEMKRERVAVSVGGVPVLRWIVLDEAESRQKSFAPASTSESSQPLQGYTAYTASSLYASPVRRTASLAVLKPSSGGAAPRPTRCASEAESA